MRRVRAVSTYEIRLPWPKPPLSLNDGGWTKAAKLARAATIRRVRKDTELLVRAARIPSAARIAVTLTYHPRDGRRRDEDNLVGTFKPICDGIVDAGLVADDDPAHMAKAMPVIGTPNPKDPHLVLTIETPEATT